MIPDDERPVHIIQSELGGITFGVDALSVELIEDANAPESEDVVLDIDLATFLKLDSPPKDSMRRTVIVKVRRGQIRIRLGELTRVSSLAPGAVHPLPSFFGELAREAGIRSVFEHRGGLGFVVDVEAIGSAGAR